MAIDLQKLEQKFDALFNDPTSVTDFEQWLEARNVSQHDAKLPVSCRFSPNKENSDNEGLNFVIELGHVMAVDGKVNVDRYCNILNLVAKYFVEKEATKDKPLSAEFLIETGFSEDNNGHFWLNLQTHYLELIPMPDGYYPVYIQVPEMSSEIEQRVNLIKIETFKELKNLIKTISGRELKMAINEK